MDFLTTISILLPAVITLAFFVYRNNFTMNEVQAHSLAIVVVIFNIAAINLSEFISAMDLEVWNGQITEKDTSTYYCNTSWSDFPSAGCRNYTTRIVKGSSRIVCTGTGENRTCHTETTQKTQYRYEFAWERDYKLVTNIDTSYEIPRVDRQGSKVPPRYAESYVGEPASDTKIYRNWIRGASNNLFHEDGVLEEKYKPIIPSYPIEVYDYHRVDRVLGVHVKVPQGANEALAEALKVLGPAVQMNAVVVLVDSTYAGQDYSLAVRRAWFGFKKNDAVIFVGLRDNKVEWANVLSWSKDNMFDVLMRDAIYENHKEGLNFDILLSDLKTISLEHYKRQSMKEFEYLRSQIPVSNWSILFVLLVSAIATPLILIYGREKLLEHIRK